MVRIISAVHGFCVCLFCLLVVVHDYNNSLYIHSRLLAPKWAVRLKVIVIAISAAKYHPTLALQMAIEIDKSKAYFELDELLLVGFVLGCYYASNNNSGADQTRATAGESISERK